VVTLLLGHTLTCRGLAACLSQPDVIFSIFLTLEIRHVSIGLIISLVRLVGLSWVAMSGSVRRRRQQHSIRDGQVKVSLYVLVVIERFGFSYLT
jgi:hypothetical protein